MLTVNKQTCWITSLQLRRQEVVFRWHFGVLTAEENSVLPLLLKIKQTQKKTAALAMKFSFILKIALCFCFTITVSRSRLALRFQCLWSSLANESFSHKALQTPVLHIPGQVFRAVKENTSWLFQRMFYNVQRAETQFWQFSNFSVDAHARQMQSVMLIVMYYKNKT